MDTRKDVLEADSVFIRTDPRTWDRRSNPTGWMQGWMHILPPLSKIFVAFGTSLLKLQI